jgi:hypothetical protein
MGVWYLLSFGEFHSSDYGSTIQTMCPYHGLLESLFRIEAAAI